MLLECCNQIMIHQEAISILAIETLNIVMYTKNFYSTICHFGTLVQIEIDIGARHSHKIEQELETRSGNAEDSDELQYCSVCQ